VLIAVYIGVVLMTEMTLLPGMSVTELINTVHDVDEEKCCCEYFAYSQ